MLTFEQAQEALTEIADSLPEEIYRELTGGIILLPECKLSPHAINRDLFIMGDYNHDQLGRYVRIYYGSFAEVYPHSSDNALVKHMRDVLRHELVHHLESLAGARSLELEDEENLDDYYHKYESRRQE